MNGNLKIECGLEQVSDVMLCADCRKATTLFRERCMGCGRANVFTVRDVLDGKVDLAEVTRMAGLNWISSVIDQLFADASSEESRIAA